MVHGRDRAGPLAEGDVIGGAVRPDPLAAAIIRIEAQIEVQAATKIEAGQPADRRQTWRRHIQSAARQGRCQRHRRLAAHRGAREVERQVADIDPLAAIGGRGIGCRAGRR